MSDLDDIYTRCDISNNRTENPLGLDEFKQQIKDLMLEIIGKDGVPSNSDPYALSQNFLRDALRQKVEEL